MDNVSIRNLTLDRTVMSNMYISSLRCNLVHFDTIRFLENKIGILKIIRCYFSGSVGFNEVLENSIINSSYWDDFEISN